MALAKILEASERERRIENLNLVKRIERMETTTGENSRQQGTPIPQERWNRMRRRIPSAGGYSEEPPVVQGSPGLVMLLAQLRAAVDRPRGSYGSPFSLCWSMRNEQGQ
jgi:hypothetical protein